MGAVSGTASVTAGGASEEPGGDAVVPSGTAGCADMAPTTDDSRTFATARNHSGRRQPHGLHLMGECDHVPLCVDVVLVGRYTTSDDRW